MIQVNDSVISESRILAEMQYHPAKTQREAMLQAAETLIVGELLRQRAQALGLAPLASDGDALDETLLEALLVQEVRVPEASEATCLQYYQANPGKFVTPPLLAVCHILLACAPDDDVGRVETKARAWALLQQLQQGADFAEQALVHSACPSKTLGGSLGQVSRGQTVPEFERQVFVAEPGLLPAPIESRYGFHLVQIDHKVPGRPLPYEQVRGSIAEYLNAKVQRKALAQYLQILAGEAQIAGYDIGGSGSPLLQ